MVNSSVSPVAIVTVTYNAAEFIVDYLQSLKGLLQSENFKLAIIDNASSDNTCEIIEHFITDNGLQNRILVKRSTQNYGFGKGCNEGVKLAKAFSPEFYWFLNPDTQLRPNAGAALRAFLDSQPKVAFCSSELQNAKGEPRPSGYRFPSLGTVILERLKLGVLDRLFVSKQVAFPVSEQPAKADWLTGASFMARADVFDQLGGFDERYFLYFEEVDLFLNAGKAGFAAWVCPDSKVCHISGASTGMNNHHKAIKRRPKYWYESRRYFYLKNYGRGYFIAVDAFFVLATLLWRLRSLVQRKEDCDPPYLLRDIVRHSGLFS